MHEATHGGIAHFDDAARWACDYDAEDRDAWQRPDLVLDLFELDDDATVADLGSATGYFTTRIARRIPRGRVYGVDKAPGMVDYLRERAGAEALDNIEVRLGGRDDPALPPGVDTVLAANLLRFLRSPQAYLSSLHAQLEAGAKVVVVDWKDPASEEAVVGLMTEAGFSLLSRDAAMLPAQYVLTFRR